MVNLLGMRSLIKTSTFEGTAYVKVNKILYTGAVEFVFPPFQARIKFNNTDCFTTGSEFSEGHCEMGEPGHRKQWAARPSDTVLQVLGNASLMSSDSMASNSQNLTGSVDISMETVVSLFPLM